MNVTLTYSIAEEEIERAIDRRVNELQDSGEIDPDQAEALWLTLWRAIPASFTINLNANEPEARRAARRAAQAV